MKTYMTLAGAEKLRQELLQLKTSERPRLVEIVAWAASNGDRSENADYQYGKKRLREIDRRMSYLIKKLEVAEVIDPFLQPTDRVLFGLWVRVLHADDSEREYQIVGEDEIDVDAGKISWKSPLAKALLGKSVGDEVILKKPKAVEVLEILEIRKPITS